jgi:tetratricopeptide (TPR) repeat protein
MGASACCDCRALAGALEHRADGKIIRRRPARGKGIAMKRLHWVVVVIVSCALLGGCHNKKDPNDPSKSSHGKGSDQEKLAAAQREVKQNPDKFETASDPPLNADTRFAAGLLAESQGDANRAVAQYVEALKLDPNHKNSLFHLGALYTQTGHYNEAVTTWQRYMKATNYAPASYNNLALCYEQAGKLDEAEKTYRAGIAKDPADTSCRLNYGLMLARHGRMDDATAQLQTVCTPAEVQYNLGSVFEQQGNKEEARRRYQRALELDPKLVDARSRLAQLK